MKYLKTFENFTYKLNELTGNILITPNLIHNIGIINKELEEIRNKPSVNNTELLKKIYYELYNKKINKVPDNIIDKMKDFFNKVKINKTEHKKYYQQIEEISKMFSNIK